MYGSHCSRNLINIFVIVLKMKYVIALICFAVLAACSEDENLNEQIPDNAENGLSVSDIKGIWEGKENDLFFISFSENGKYSFCFNQQLMGSGNYEIDKDSIIFYNQYLSIKDKAKIEINNSTLSIVGSFLMFNRDDSMLFAGHFQKSDEEQPVSLIGEQWRSNKILNVYGDRREYLDVLTEYLIKYRLVKADGIETPIRSKTWFYINRKDLLYAQIKDEDGTIHLYKSPFIYVSRSGISSLEIDF